MNEKYYDHGGLKYYEIANNLQPLVLIHAQGVDGSSYTNVAKQLSRKFHIYSIDCYGHGGSRHDPAAYNIKSISEAVIDFIEQVIQSKVWLVGHSSGGLIAAFIAAETDLCDKLILEDPPFFDPTTITMTKIWNGPCTLPWRPGAGSRNSKSASALQNSATPISATPWDHPA